MFHLPIFFYLDLIGYYDTIFSAHYVLIVWRPFSIINNLSLLLYLYIIYSLKINHILLCVTDTIEVNFFLLLDILLRTRPHPWLEKNWPGMNLHQTNVSLWTFIYFIEFLSNFSHINILNTICYVVGSNYPYLLKYASKFHYWCQFQ